MWLDRNIYLFLYIFLSFGGDCKSGDVTKKIIENSPSHFTHIQRVTWDSLRLLYTMLYFFGRDGETTTSCKIANIRLGWVLWIITYLYILFIYFHGFMENLKKCVLNASWLSWSQCVVFDVGDIASFVGTLEMILFLVYYTITWRQLKW
jgi:hypothetical protein